jgi:hypothetical protein
VLERALGEGDLRVLPTVLGDVDLPFALSSIQALRVDLAEGSGNIARRVADVASELLGRPIEPLPSVPSRRFPEEEMRQWEERVRNQELRLASRARWFAVVSAVVFLSALVSVAFVAPFGSGEMQAIFALLSAVLGSVLTFYLDRRVFFTSRRKKSRGDSDA